MQELLRNRLYVFVEPSFGANQYLLSYPEAWVSIEASVPWSEVDQAQLCSWSKPGKIILTHGHLDHLGRVDEWKNRTKAPVFAHKEELLYFDHPMYNGTGMYGNGQVYSHPEHLLEDFEQISLADDEYLETWHLPGHTLGSCIFLWFKKVAAPSVAASSVAASSVETRSVATRCPLGLFTGDVLIERTIGRTDFPGGNPKAMQTSLTELLPRLQALPPDLPVFCGHGEVLTVQEILQYNPWLRCK